HDGFGLSHVGEFLRTRIGELWLARAGVGLLSVNVLLFARGRRLLSVLPLAAILLAGLVSYAGHAASPPGEVWSTLNDLGHLIAGSAWIGGLAVLALYLRPRVGRETRAQATHQFSQRAVLALVFVLVTGTI